MRISDWSSDVCSSDLKAKLQAEGLFDAERKRPLPAWVRRLGVLTSPSGAAVRDVLSVLARRFPLLDVEVLPVPVQGAAAAAQITSMLQRAAASGRFDALLRTRGDRKSTRLNSSH